MFYIYSVYTALSVCVVLLHISKNTSVCIVRYIVKEWSTSTGNIIFNRVNKPGRKQNLGKFNYTRHVFTLRIKVNKLGGMNF